MQIKKYKKPRRYFRPADIRSYLKQVEFMDAPERFVIVEATAKAGKTTGCLFWLLEQALLHTGRRNYWWLAPVRKTAKMAFDRMRYAIGTKNLIETNKTELTITFTTGATIFFKTADSPDSLYGEDVYGIVIDEASRMKEEAWFAVNTVLTATNGMARIIGNVQGDLNWAYKLARQVEAGKKPGWRYFKITATDALAAGILKQEAVDAARDNLPEAVFRELYYAETFVNTANKFCYSFDEKKHVGPCEFRRDRRLFLSFDFNYNPICCSVFQAYKGTIWCLRTIKLPSSNINELCDVILKLYGRADYHVTGDASGHHHSGISTNNQNCYNIIKHRLSVPGMNMHTPTSNPPLRENRVRVNTYLEKFRVQIDPVLAADMISDLKYVQVNPDGSIKKGNRNDPHQQADLLDTFRYLCANVLSQSCELPIPYLDSMGY